MSTPSIPALVGDVAVRLATHAAVRLHRDKTGAWMATNLQTLRELRLSPVAVAMLVACVGGASTNQASARVRARFSVSDQDVQRALQTLEARGMLVPVGDSQSQLASRITRCWAAGGWRDAADYYLATFDYPFLDYSTRESFQLDAERMRSYVAEGPDLERSKSYPSSDGRLQPTLPTRDALRGLRPTLADTIAGSSGPGELTRAAVETLMTVAFGKLRSRIVHAPGRAAVVRRTSPSGGSRHPTEGYVLAHAVEDLPDAVYHFSTEGYYLERVADPVGIEQFAECDGADLGKGDPSALVLLTSVFERNMYRYREPRTFRTVFIDAGHIVSTLDLTARALGLRSKRCYGVRHDSVEEHLGLEPSEEGSLCGVLVREVLR